MKKKKILVFNLILVLIVTTGCSANYTLKYEDDTFTEYVNITGDSEDEAHPTYSDILENDLYADIDGIEKFELEPESTRYDVTLTHELESVKLERLQAVSECFNLNTYKETESSYYLALYGGFTCTFLTDSTFTLETDAKVLTNNAHEIDGNKYTWYLNEDKLGDEGITFQVMKSTVEKSSLKTDTVLPIWLKILIVLILIGSGFGLVFIIENYKKR